MTKSSFIGKGPDVQLTARFKQEFAYLSQKISRASEVALCPKAGSLLCED